MKFGPLAALALSLGCAACDYTTATFRPYETRDPVVVGQGGARETVDGVDIWTMGGPPRRYQVLGTVELEGYEGYGSPNQVLAAKVKEVGGSAAIRLQRGTSAYAAIPAALTIAINRTNATYLAVRYLD